MYIIIAAGLGRRSMGRPRTEPWQLLPWHRCPEEPVSKGCSLSNGKGHKKPAEAAISHHFPLADGILQRALESFFSSCSLMGEESLAKV